MKRVKTFSSALALLCAVTLSASASEVSAPYVSEIFPNTDDDASLEYFSLRNPSCQSVTLSGYSIADASWKVFRFPSVAVLDPLSSFSYFRPETKITLNNENETLSLFDPFGVTVDSFSYVTSTKNAPVPRSGFSDDLCPILQDDASDAVIETPVESGSDAASPEEIPPETPESDIAEPSDGSLLPFDNPSPNDVGEPPAEWTQDSAVPAVPSAVPEPGLSGTGLSGASASSWSAVAAADPVSVRSVVSSGSIATPSSVSKTSESRGVAEALALVDSNADGRFDYAEIRYSEAVFWTPDPMEFLLYSKTWGLYEQRVASTWGYFSSAVAVGPVLRLAFSGTTLPKASFRIDSSTSSEFRIKTSSSMSSLKTVSSGLPVMPLGLTTSFSGYSADRISFIPGFPEADESESPDSDAHSEVDANVPAPTVSWTWTVPVPADPVSKKKVPKTAPKVATDVLFASEFSIVPSSWVDLLPDGKYSLVCFSKTCSPSFKVEGLPPKAKGYWLFADGRKRYGTSTSTLGKSVPAKYRLSYVLETPEGGSNVPIELSVIPESPPETLKSRAETVTKTMASSASKASQSKSPTSKTASPSVKSQSGKTSTGGVVSETGKGGGADGWRPYRTVSVAVASAFVWLAGWAGWLAYRRRSWLPEETP